MMLAPLLDLIDFTVLLADKAVESFLEFFLCYAFER